MAPTPTLDLASADGAPLRRARRAGEGDDGRLNREHQRWLAWALASAIPLSTLLFGAAHEALRLPLALVYGGLGAVALARGGGHDGAARGLPATVGLGLLAGLLAGLSFLPVGPELRRALQPGTAQAVLAALAEAGRGDAWRPLALDPGRGLVEWAMFLACLLVLGGTAALVRNRARGRRLAAVILATGVSVTVLGLAQRWGQADKILWFSDVPLTTDRPFFGPFVNPNHAGVLLAAAAPGAAALLFDRRSTTRLLAGLGLLLLLVGALACGSRGAVVLMGLGLVASLGLGGTRAHRLALAGGLGILALVLLLLGPVQVAEWLTGTLDPAQAEAIGMGHQDLWSGRGRLYQDLLGMLSGAPLLGVGPGSFDDAYRVVRTEATFTFSDHAHQELLQAVIEHGLPATLLGLAGLVPVLDAARRPDPQGGSLQRRLQAGFLGALVVVGAAAMYELPLRSGALSLLAAACAGAVLGLAEGRSPRASLRPILAIAGATLIGLAGICWIAGRGSAQSSFGDASERIEAGRRTLQAAGIERQAWSQGGDAEALRQAGEAFQAALWARPVDRIALQELARVRQHQGDAEGAVRALEVATVIWPSLPWAWRDLARLHRAHGASLASWSAWSRALAYDMPAGEDPDTWIREALQGGDPELVAMAVLPPRADRWDQAARVLEDEGDLALAEALLREAVLLDPALHAQLAFALLRWGRPAEALAALPEPATGCGEQRARAEALLQLRRCEEAVPLAEQALGSCGAVDRPARLTMARVRACAGDERAIGALEALVREDPDDHGPRRTLAFELARRGRTEDALRQLEALEAAAALKADDAELLQRLRGSSNVTDPTPPP